MAVLRSVALADAVLCPRSGTTAWAPLGSPVRGGRATVTHSMPAPKGCRGLRYSLGVLRLRHAARLAGNLVGYAVVNRVWWILPLVLLLGIAALLIVAGQAAAPVTLYPMF